MFSNSRYVRSQLCVSVCVPPLAGAEPHGPADERADGHSTPLAHLLSEQRKPSKNARYDEQLIPLTCRCQCGPADERTPARFQPQATFQHNGGVSSATEVRPASAWRGVLLLGASLIPAVIAVLPLTLGPAWYLSADENEPYLTSARVLWMLAAFTVALVPFAGAVVALLSVRFAGYNWAQACRVAAAWAFGLGCLAFVTAMVYGAGF